MFVRNLAFVVAIFVIQSGLAFAQSDPFLYDDLEGNEAVVGDGEEGAAGAEEGVFTGGVGNLLDLAGVNKKIEPQGAFEVIKKTPSELAQPTGDDAFDYQMRKEVSRPLPRRDAFGDDQLGEIQRNLSNYGKEDADRRKDQELFQEFRKY